MSSTHVIPHPPMLYVIRPGGRSPPGKWQIWSRPPELGDRHWSVGYKPGHLHWRFTLAKSVRVHPGDVYFSREHCPPPPPIIHLIALQWFEWAERALIQQKKDATLAIDIIPRVPFTDSVRCSFNSAGCPQLGFGTQLKFEKISPGSNRAATAGWLKSPAPSLLSYMGGRP